MKKLIILTLLSFPFLLTAQSIALDYGNSSSSFIYKDSNGEKLTNLKNKWGQLLNIKYIRQLNNKINVGVGLNKNEYGAESLDSENNLAWDMSYFGVNLGFDYKIELCKTKKDTLSKSYKDLALILNTNFSHSWLTKGSQQIDNRIYDLNEFDGGFSNLTRIQVGLGFLYGLNEHTSINLRYSINRGLTNMETNGQELFIIAHHILFGIIIDLKQNKNNK